MISNVFKHFFNHHDHHLDGVSLILYFFVFDRQVLEQRDSVYEKISQYLQLRSIIQSLQVRLWNWDQDTGLFRTRILD